MQSVEASDSSGIIGARLSADQREAAFYGAIVDNAWLEGAVEDQGALRLHVGLRARLRGNDRGTLRINRADDSEVLPEIAPDKVSVRPGRVVAEYVIPTAALIADAVPGSLAGYSLWMTIEFGEDRRARVLLPIGYPDVRPVLVSGDHAILLRRSGRVNLGLRIARRTGSALAPGSRRAESKRVMILANRLTFGGGKTKAIFQLARELAAGGHDVCITTLWFEGIDPRYPFPEGVGYDFIDGDYLKRPGDGKAGSSRFVTATGFATSASDVRFALYFERNRFDLIYVPNYDSPMYRLLRDLVPPTTVLLIGDHHPSRAERAERGSTNADFLYAIRTYDAVHTVNPLIRDVLQTLTPKQVFTIPNMVDKGTPIVRDDRFFATRNLVSIGRLMATKRMDHVIKAFALLAADFPEWTLDIFGYGKEEAALTELIEQLGLQDRATMRGFDPEVVEIMGRGAVVVSASAAEAHPLVTIEAMVAGCPVVSYDKQYGARYLVEDGVTGYLAADADIEALAARIADVFRLIEARDVSVLELIARAGATTGAFSRKEISALWLAKVAELCAAKNASPIKEPRAAVPTSFLTRLGLGRRAGT